MCKRSILTIIAVAILALAIGQAQAITVDVPNGDFAMYKPGTDIPVVSWSAGYDIWVQQIGMNRPLSGDGTVTFADSTTGTVVDIPGWTTPAPGATGNADLYFAGYDATDGTSALNTFGSWSAGNGGLAVSENPLDLPGGSGVYTLSAMVAGPAGPRTLDLLVDGVAITPDSQVDPEVTGGGLGHTPDMFRVISRTYNAIPAGDVTILVGIKMPPPDLYESRLTFDHITLDFESDEPTLPDVDAGPDMITWSGQKVELDPNVVNNSNPVTALTFAWSANDPCAVFDPSADVEDPNVTIIKPATVTTAVSIANQGFETQVLADGDYTSDFTDCPGWSDVDVNTAGGVWNPGLPGTAFPGYGGNAPEGQNIAYVNSSGIKQVLTKTFALETTYTLTVKVGNNADPGLTWGGYKVQLLAGETVIAEDNNTLTPAVNTFKISTVTYTYDPGDSALLGQPLQIRLLIVNGGGTNEVDFDDVKLTAEAPTPVPYVVTLTLAVNNEGSTGPDVKDTMKIYVYNDACEAARIGKDMGTDNPGDFDEDCITDANDLDELATKWLTGGALTVPIPKP